jgi:four helix bundle protein
MRLYPRLLRSSPSPTVSSHGADDPEGTRDANRLHVAKTVEELLVYQKALAAAREVSVLLDRPAFQRDRDLGGQMNRASIRVASDISEGFEQKTDRHFAKYLYDSRGGTREIRTQLRIAVSRKYIAEGDERRVGAMYTEIGKMLSGLICHLERDDWKSR